MTVVSPPRSCASCDETGCAMNRRHGIAEPPATRTSYVLDDVWPEYASIVAATRRPGDQLLAPGIWGPRPARYLWPNAQHKARRATAHRHYAMRKVAGASGSVRQRTYLKHDRAVARALARAIDFRAGHLVIALAWLPWLDEAGALGGRSFDVLMNRYPFAEIHQRLDIAAAGFGASATIGDFRAGPKLVDREMALLARARRIITPHHGIAGLFPDQAVRLAWHRPTPPAQHCPGHRVAFLGPTIARERPDLVRALAGSLEQPLVVFGDMLERPDYWDGIAIERRAFGPGWLDGIGAIIHPATMTSQPRRLLQAIASGVRIYATDGSGLDPADYSPLCQFDDQAGAVAVKPPEIPGAGIPAPPRRDFPTFGERSRSGAR